MSYYDENHEKLEEALQELKRRGVSAKAVAVWEWAASLPEEVEAWNADEPDEAEQVDIWTLVDSELDSVLDGGSRDYVTGEYEELIEAVTAMYGPSPHGKGD